MSSDPCANARCSSCRIRRRRLARVVDLFHEPVWTMALRASGNEEDAHDIVQEVFLSLLLHPPAPRSIRSPRGYLAYRVLAFVLRSRLEMR